ncbi:MAG: hypothetical protein Q9220_000600 [cf. Caloplaca sp. 1 TL-2023]
MEDESPSSATDKKISRHKPFTKEDAEELLSNGEGFLQVSPAGWESAWVDWAKNRHVGLELRVLDSSIADKDLQNSEDHTAQDWKKFWEDSIGPIFLKRRAKAAHKSPNLVGTMKSASEKPDEPKEQETANLVIRTPPAQVRQAGRRISRSPSYHPESPSRRTTAAALEQVGTDLGKATTDGTRDEETLPSFPMKRKRPISEDVEEVPSSSPPQPMHSAKRMRRGETDVPFTEIASTPERRSLKDQLREIPDTYTENQAKLADIVELEDEGDEEDEEDEEDAYESSEGDDIELEGSRSSSPELGASPRKSPSNDNERSVSKTQAIFQEPDLPPDLDVAEPPGGWSDEEEDMQAEKQGKEDAQMSVSGEAPDDEDEDRAEIPIKQEPTDHEPSRTRPSSLHHQHEQPTTQVLLSLQTQEPDLSLPSPPGGWGEDNHDNDNDTIHNDNNNQPKNPTSPAASDIQSHLDRQLLPPSSSPSPPPSPDPATEVNNFLSHHLRAGHDEDSILLALRATSMLDPELAVRVLEWMQTQKQEQGGGEGLLPRDWKGVWTKDDDEALESMDARKVKAVEEKHGREGVKGRWEFWREWRRE